MSYLEYRLKTTPHGLRKVLYLNWPIALLLAAVAAIGFLMLYSVAGGSLRPWAEPQMKRFVVGFVLMILMGLVPIHVWRGLAPLAYLGGLGLLLLIDVIGDAGGGARRWINLGFMRLQPSEPMKLALVMALAAYYDWLPLRRTSHPLWVAIPALLTLVPAVLVLGQPDLGTAILLLAIGGAIMFLAGVHWAYFATVIAIVVAAVSVVLESRGTDWQILKDYQFRRIDVFLNPESDPLGAGYNITQAKIALGSGGWAGRGFMQGTQSRLNFVPEKHTDFIFTTLAEEFGFVGAATLLTLYGLILGFCLVSALRNPDRFGALVTLGVGVTFFTFFAVNMAMVMGLIPVVGVPLPLVSYGGSAMLVIMAGFGLVQSAHVHRPR